MAPFHFASLKIIFQNAIAGIRSSSHEGKIHPMTSNNSTLVLDSVVMGMTPICPLFNQNLSFSFREREVNLLPMTYPWPLSYASIQS